MKSMSPIFRDASRAQRGFAAVVAIFVLVVLGAMGAALVTVFSAQQRSSGFDAAGIHAYYAARAGVDAGAFIALNSGTCTGFTTTIAPYTVTVTCDASTHTEVATDVTIYRITATACNRAPSCPQNADGATYVERQVRGTVTDTPPVEPTA